MDPKDRDFSPVDRLGQRMRRDSSYYKRCPQCGRTYSSEKEYRQETRRDLFSSVTFGICSCGYDMEQ